MSRIECYSPSTNADAVLTRLYRYTFNYALKTGQAITSGWIMDEDGEIYETYGALSLTIPPLFLTT